MKPLLFATANPHKLREVQEILELLGLAGSIELEARAPNVAETGVTFLENAWIKAQHVFHETGRPTIAEDTGLVVDALDGAPGLFSARFAGNPTDHQMNLQKLLGLLRGRGEEARRARFVCYAVYVDEHRRVWARGEVQGLISPEIRGRRGFGYDPVFLYPPLGRTFGELPPRLKNRRSHRFHALRRLFQKLGYLP